MIARIVVLAALALVANPAQSQNIDAKTSKSLTPEVRKYQKDAAAGDTNAMFELGAMFGEGQGVTQNYATAKLWYEKAAAGGQLDAMNALGNLYQDGLGVAQDYAIAKLWYDKAAAGGQLDAMSSLGFFYRDSHGVAQNYATAKLWYEKAAAGGQVDAMSALGFFYRDGLGVAQDYATAKLWYEKAAAGGQVYAMNALGALYQDGLGVAQDYATAKLWYEKAAAGGQVFAMNALGVFYQDGRGVAQDYVTAKLWYDKAAAGGQLDAAYNLGLLYQSGSGVAQDYATAKLWFEKAAAGGSADAMYSLGVLYRDGQGTAVDIPTARSWLTKAAESGVADADAALAALDASKQVTQAPSKQAPPSVAGANRPAADAPAPVGPSVPAGLKMPNLQFVTRPATAFGDVAARGSNAFPAGEPLVMYFEIAGQTIKPTATDLRSFGLIIDQHVLNASGIVLGGQQAIADKDFVMSAEEQKKLYINYETNSDGLNPGAYTVAFTLHDKLDGRTATVSLPFTITPGASAIPTSDTRERASAYFVGLLAQRAIKDCNFVTSAQERAALDAKVAGLQPQDPALLSQLRTDAGKDAADCPNTPDMTANVQQNIRDFVAMSPEEYVGRMDKRIAEREAAAGRAKP